MATIYSGIHVKLKCPLTPWSDKLKLARFAWVSRQCLLPNKEQILFDWVSHALTFYYNKKVEVPLEIVEGLWAYFDEILHSKKLYNVLSQGKAITLNPSVAQIINERILESTSGTLSVSLSMILSCCHGILTSPVLSVTYTARYELLVKLLARVCGLACFQLKQQRSAEPLLLKVFEVLFLVLSTYLTVQRQQGNTNRVFTQVTEHLFQPLLLLRHLLATRIWTEEDDTRIRQHLNKDIRSRVDTILQSALFSYEHLLPYTEEVLPSENKSRARKEHAGRPLLRPISIIMSKLVSKCGDDDEALFYAVKCSSLPLLFKLALDSFCKKGENKLVCFQLMTKLVTSLEFTKDLSIKKTFNTGNWSLVLLALESILNYCLAGDVYNVAADRMHHGEVQFNFYRKVAQLLLSNAQTGIPAWYRCLKTLLALNHQILEPDLDEIVSFVWVDVDNMEFRVKKARETLVSEVLQTYSKLRQLPRLIAKLLDVICRPAAYELRQALLPQAVQKSLSQCLMNNPPSQNVEVCMLILEKMQNELSNMKETRGASALKLFSLSILLHAVMFSLKALDDSTPVPVVRQTQSLMEKTLTFLRALLQNLETEESDRLWRENIQDTSLLLTHTWHEADALFQIHCSKYTSPAGLSNDASPISDTIEKVLAITGSVDQDISPLSKLLQKHLALHKMKKHLLTSNENAQNNLFESANYVVDRENSLMNPNMDHTWDLQICTVNSDNYSVACWFLIITNLPLISPYLSRENASHIADVILNSVLESNFGSNTEKTDTLSASHISRQLLDSLVLCELPSVYSAVVTSIIKRMFGQLCASDIHSVCPSFLKSCTEMDASENKEEGTAEISPSLKRLKAMAQEIMDSAKAGTSLSLSEKQVGNLQQLIKIANVLNPYAMSPEDYLELFLSSFLMNLCVQHHENGSCSVPINLLKEAFDLMTFLVQSHSHKVLKIVHGSTLLESTMTSLLSSLSKGLFGSVDVSVWISLLRSVQCFIQCLIQMIICRKISVRLNLETFSNFMVEKVAAVGTSSVNSGKCEEAQRLIELHLAALSTLCQGMMSLFGNNKHLNETVTKLLEKTVFVMVPAIQPVITATAGSVIRKSFTVDVVTVMIESELAMASHHTDDIDVGDAQDKLSHTVVYKCFGQQIMKEFCSAPQPMDFLISSIHYLSALYLAAMTTKESDLEDLYLEILKSIHKLLSSAWLSGPEVKELEAPVKELLDQLVISCSEEQFHLLLLMFQDGLVASKIERGYYRDVLATVTVIKLLACCSLSGICSKAFWVIVPQIISSLVFLVRECSGVASLTSALTLPAVDTLTTLLRQGESWISSAHNVIMVLGALQFVPLENQSMEEYHSAFQAIHEALFAIILCYPKVMLKSAPTFLNCFYRLVTSIIYEGKQKGINEREKGSEELLKCARLVERMYTHIGKTAEGFTIMSSFIVAQYVNQLQKVTLRPEIKAHLTEGIYCILDQCIEKDIKFLNRTLQMGVKEVFDELYKDYTHYHKSQWQGEEKYTA